VFGRSDFARIARGFGAGGERITDLTALPDRIAAFRKTGGAAIWDFPVCDQVASPVIRRAHPPKSAT
ncbi:MAG: thiamine pyrophosphate-binding protein, partial [Litoreibacter sp.]|nr:thiamine pyrophosphate-binding protein [Litoreibacter sp.]